LRHGERDYEVLYGSRTNYKRSAVL
jgi:hypothetical protein